MSSISSLFLIIHDRLTGFLHLSFRPNESLGNAVLAAGSVVLLSAMRISLLIQGKSHHPSPSDWYSTLMDTHFLVSRPDSSFKGYGIPEPTQPPHRDKPKRPPRLDARGPGRGRWRLQDANVLTSASTC